MKDLTKAFPGGREVFKGITLSFLPGVKIGVLGVNGAGKSTLMKIMAGIEKEYGGEAWAAEGVTRRLSGAGAAARSRQDRVRERQDGVRPLQPRVDRFNAISDRFGEPMDDDEIDELLAEQGDAAGEDRRRGRLGRSTASSRSRWKRCAARRRMPSSTRCRAASAAGWRLPAAAGEARHPAARRADQPSRRRKRRLAGAHLSDYAGTVMLVTHDRYFLDNVANWILEIDRGRGYPYEGNYSGPGGRSASGCAGGRRRRVARRRSGSELDWIRQPQGAPDQEQGAHPRSTTRAGRSQTEPARQRRRS